jgi:hypothetical protein
MWATFEILKSAQSKLSPDGRKFAKSSHPAARQGEQQKLALLFNISAAAFRKTTFAPFKTVVSTRRYVCTFQCTYIAFVCYVWCHVCTCAYICMYMCIHMVCTYGHGYVHMHMGMLVLIPTFMYMNWSDQSALWSAHTRNESKKNSSVFRRQKIPLEGIPFKEFGEIEQNFFPSLFLTSLL